MTEPQVITKNDNPNNPTSCRFVRTLPRCSQQLLSYESGGRYPALPAAQSMTTPMLATTTPMLATNNYYQARLNFVEAKKNRPRTPKRPRPDTARRPQGLQKIRKEQRRESADFDQNQKTIKFKIGHRIPQGLIKSRRWSTAGGANAARIKQLANHETNLYEHRHKEDEAAKQGQVAEHRCPAYQPLPKNNAHKSSGFQYT